jgi:3-oxoacyl-[acyl-carrier-protein] synthase-1
MRPLAITAMSLVNAMGSRTEEVLDALFAGRSGLLSSAAEGLPLSVPFPTFVGAVPGELAALPTRFARYDTRLARIGWKALEEIRGDVEGAITRWGKHRVAVLIGTSTGGLDATEVAYRAWGETGAVPASFDLRHQHDFNALGELIAESLGVEGPVYVVSTACSSSAKVHASAARLMDLGLIDAALVGGIDSLCRMTLHGFRGLGILSETRCKPFAADRSGINIGEGAGLMLVERVTDATSARARAFVLGAGESSDAYNMSSPEPSGRGAKEAMQRALESGNLRADQVDLVIAHGTATQQNDMAEALAIEGVLGLSTPVISTKAYTGHQLGAAGATSAAFAAAMVARDAIPPSLGAEPMDASLRVRVLGEGGQGASRVVLANAFAFGGSNVCLAIAGAPFAHAHLAGGRS